MLQPRPKFDRNKASSTIPDFWESLSIFWDEGQVNKWKGTGIESCFNLISLMDSAHTMWNKGLFALKPLKLSRDRETLSVQFFWQVPNNYKIDSKIDSKIDLLTETQSSEGLDTIGQDADGDGFFCLAPRMTVPQFRAFVLETSSLSLPRTPQTYRYQAWNS
jgi:HNH endonuclease